MTPSTSSDAPMSPVVRTRWAFYTSLVIFLATILAGVLLAPVVPEGIGMTVDDSTSWLAAVAVQLVWLLAYAVLGAVFAPALLRTRLGMDGLSRVTVFRAFAAQWILVGIAWAALVAINVGLMPFLGPLLAVVVGAISIVVALAIVGPILIWLLGERPAAAFASIRFRLR